MTPGKFGYYTAIITTFLALVTFIIAIMTPPLSGPLCAGSCLEYPFTEAVSRFPRDYFWMYPALFLKLSYLILVVCIHQTAAGAEKLFSQIALCLAWLASSTLLVTYYVQLTVIQPSLLKGEHDGIAILSQYNPHGLFIALEEIGYLAMSASFMVLVPNYWRQMGRKKAIGWIFLTNALLSLAALISNSMLYGIHREYRFEIAIITVNWCTLILSGPLLAGVLKGQQHHDAGFPG